MAGTFEVRGAPVLMTPVAGVAYVAGADDEDALRTMYETSKEYFEGSDEYRSLRATTFVDGAWREWLPAEGHALRARFREGASRTKMRELSDVASHWAKDVPVAHHAVVSDSPSTRVNRHALAASAGHSQLHRPRRRRSRPRIASLAAR
jgi:hypothetical protein